MPKYIDVDELKDWVDNWFIVNRYYHQHSRSKNIPSSELFDLIERMPTADVIERKKGKWIKRGISLYKCSECERFSPTQENYCPKCGADMREGNINDQTT